MTRMDAMNTNEIYFLCLISIMPAQAKLKQIIFDFNSNEKKIVAPFSTTLVEQLKECQVYFCLYN